MIPELEISYYRRTVDDLNTAQEIPVADRSIRIGRPDLHLVESYLGAQYRIKFNRPLFQTGFVEWFRQICILPTTPFNRILEFQVQVLAGILDVLDRDKDHGCAISIDHRILDHGINNNRFIAYYPDIEIIGNKPARSIIIQIPDRDTNRVDTHLSFRIRHKFGLPFFAIVSELPEIVVGPFGR